MQDGRSHFLTKEPRECYERYHLEKSRYMRCAGLITTGIKAPKSPREMGCCSAIPIPVSEHCTE